MEFCRRARLAVAALLLGLPALVIAGPVPPIGFDLIEQRDRPGDHFTQGLFFDGERWWESSGQYGRSWLAEYTDPTARPVRRKWLAEDRFAEGMTVLGDRIYLLTYKAGELQLYGRKDMKPLGKRFYAGEGWGLTSDGRHLIMSNGSDTLTFRDPDTFAILRELQVHGDGEQWWLLNELEYAQGLVWANIFQDTRIIAIDPESGEVRGVMDIEELEPGSDHPDVVANGIAWDRERNGLWVTGKFWPRLYLIRPRGLGFDEPDSSDQPR
ncbi:glutaminyl-peptide cyclotransferase [Microbulbifer guangxiensis]|uniref:glutaminyl-peptide cyclotransferase n=1 Tax=Microbulbifer guangxiensis TaxID=2904249 RepID=UPI001F3EF28E|nr:glutaminyl-peptide cyclotransferase [Microbulbifer guangxiensis]